jgi:hypothetical protein
MGGEKHDFRKNGRKIFLYGGLDKANQVGIADENRRFDAVNVRTSATLPAAQNAFRRFCTARDKLLEIDLHESPQASSRPPVLIYTSGFGVRILLRL